MEYFRSFSHTLWPPWMFCENKYTVYKIKCLFVPTNCTSRNCMHKPSQGLSQVHNHFNTSCCNQILNLSRAQEQLNMSNQGVFFWSHIFSFPRFVKRYSKRSKKWTAQPKPKPKTYSYIPDLMERIVAKRLVVFGHLSQHVTLSDDDPRRISSTIAKVPAPSLEKLVQDRLDRMNKSQNNWKPHSHIWYENVVFIRSCFFKIFRNPSQTLWRLGSTNVIAYLE